MRFAGTWRWLILCRAGAEAVRDDYVSQGNHMAETRTSISNFFKNALGAPLGNTRWSWGAVNSTTGHVFLRVWDDEREMVNGIDRVHILGTGWARSSLGWPEREKHVELLRRGAEAYGVLCVAKNPGTRGARTIKQFDHLNVLKFGPLIDEAGHVFATITGAVAAESVGARIGRQQKVGIPEGITTEDLKDALHQLAAGASHPFGKSTRWDVVYGKARFPPKAVLGLAARRLAGRILGPYDFQGGEGSKCNRILAQLGFPPVPKGDRTQDRDEEEESAEQEIAQRCNIGPTEKLNLVKSRRGQGIYRINLELVEKRCRVTNLRDRAHLRASHIKPWCKCTDAEKLDGFNGLLLSPHVDHLFDRGYISFSDAGKVLVSAGLTKEVLTCWGIRLPRNVGPFRQEQRRYLEYHRREVFQESGRS